MGGFFSWLGWLFGFRTTNTEEVTKIQAGAVRLCGFLPTVDTVLALLSTANPTVATASIIAKKICAAVTNAKSVSTLMGGEMPKPMVDGIVIEGEFIGKDK